MENSAPIEVIEECIPDAATQQWVWEHLVSSSQKNDLIRTMRRLHNEDNDIVSEPMTSPRQKRIREEPQTEEHPEPQVEEPQHMVE